MREWIAGRHYLNCAPPGYVLAVESLEGRRRVGAALVGKPNSRKPRRDEADAVVQTPTGGTILGTLKQLENVENLCP